VIVVTGPGRSGTTLLASLYRELGFDPGGTWTPSVRAGLEDREIVSLNLALARALGVSIRERRGGRLLEGAGTLVRASDGRLSPALRRPLTAAVDVLRYWRSTPDLMDWDALARTVERYGEQMRALAAGRPVVKDPRFCFTLRAWLAAGAPIEAVVFTVRPLDAMADSRVRVSMYSRRARDWARHNYCYGIGLLTTAVAEHRLPLTTLRFPDFIKDPDHLYRVLPLPQPRTADEFQRAFSAVVDPSLVHDER
jgi:hypothetical protein